MVSGRVCFLAARRYFFDAAKPARVYFWTGCVFAGARLLHYRLESGRAAHPRVCVVDSLRSGGRIFPAARTGKFARGTTRVVDRACQRVWSRDDADGIFGMGDVV